MEHLTNDQQALLKEISEMFSPEDSAADMSILYEVTGYQAESENFQFWDNYGDFEDLSDQIINRRDKIEEENMQTENASGKRPAA